MQSKRIEKGSRSIQDSEGQLMYRGPTSYADEGVLTWLDEGDLYVLSRLVWMGDEPIRDPSLHRTLHHKLGESKILP